MAENLKRSVQKTEDTDLILFSLAFFKAAC